MMKKEICEEIPEEFIKIYKTILKLTIPSANKINAICKEISELEKHQILPPNISTGIIAAIKKGYTNKESIGKLKGKAKTNYAIDVLIYLLVKTYGRQFRKIGYLLEDSEIVRKNGISYEKVGSSDALRIRYNRIKQDAMIKQYVKFLDASRTAVVTQQGGPDTTANITVSWGLPSPSKLFKD